MMNRIFGPLFCVLLLALPPAVYADDAQKQELAKLKGDLADVMQQFGQGHPTTKKLTDKIQQLEKELAKSKQNKNGLRSMNVGDLDAPEVAKMLTSLFGINGLTFTGSNSTGEIYYWWLSDADEETIKKIVLKMRESQQYLRDTQLLAKHKADVASVQPDVATKQTQAISQQQLKELRDQYEVAERNVTKLAQEIVADPGKHGELAKLVQQAFDLRQKLQLAQVASGRARLDAIEQRIQARASVRQQVVARRVEELIAKSQDSGNAVYSELRGARIELIPEDTYGIWLIGGRAFVVSRKTSLERESRMIFPDKKVRPDTFKLGMVVDVEYHTQNDIHYADEIEIQKK